MTITAVSLPGVEFSAKQATKEMGRITGLYPSHSHSFPVETTGGGLSPQLQASANIAAEIDAVLNEMERFREDAARAVQRGQIKEFRSAAGPQWLRRFEMMLKRGSQFLVDDYLTVADLSLFDALESLETMVPKAILTTKKIRYFHARYVFSLRCCCCYCCCSDSNCVF